MDKPAAAVIGDFLRRFEHTEPAQRVKILAAGVPVAAPQHVALHHDDPWLRRRCLDLLDHHAADDSTDVFLAALDDPVAPVREIALHGLACERCRTTEVCVTDVVPRVIRTLDEDPAAEVRYRTLVILRNYADRHTAAHAALEHAATADRDPVLREGARLALGTGLLPSRNDLARKIRKRDRTPRGPSPASTGDLQTP